MLGGRRDKQKERENSSLANTKGFEPGNGSEKAALKDPEGIIKGPGEDPGEEASLPRERPNTNEQGHEALTADGAIPHPCPG